MAFVTDYFTGFEMGAIPLDSINIIAGGGGTPSATTAAKKTGSYSMLVPGGGFGSSVKFPITNSGDIYIGVWFRTQSTSLMAVDVQLTDSSYIRVSNSGTNIVCSVNGGGTLATTTNTFTVAQWAHLQIHIVVANAGSIEVKLDGVQSITYSGDTQPGAVATVSTVNFYSNASTYFDDIVIGTGGWPGDFRVDVAIPTSDTAVQQWSYTGTSAYQAIDEIPSNTTDYIYTTGSAQQSIFGIGDFDSSNKSIQVAMIWAYAKKSIADGAQIKLIDDDGVNTNVGTGQDLGTSSYSYIRKLLLVAPDGNTWTDAKADGLQIGVESYIP